VTAYIQKFLIGGGTGNTTVMKCDGGVTYSESQWVDWTTPSLSKSAEQEQQSQQSIPAGYALEQSYPNPFNPSTTITFMIPVNSYVSLKVYNSLGQVMAELAGREYSAGRHSVTFNASNLASGIYYYSMRAGEFTMVQKMILQK
jgi:hypothetical protein